MLFRLIGVFLSLPFEIKGRVFGHYLNRVTRRTSSDHQAIWTSFFYFAGRHEVEVSDAGREFEVRFSFHGKQITTRIRKGNSTDIFAFFQVFIAEGYKPLLDLLKRISAVPKTVIDAGANVGYFSQLLTCYFDPAKLVALEPDAENFGQLKKNLKDESFDLVESAIWSETRELFLDKHPDGDWAVKVGEQNTGLSCRAISLTDLLGTSGIRQVGLLKLDIEGAEDTLFKSAQFLDALENVDVVAMEIHERMADKNKILTELRERQFEYFSEGELTVAWKRIR